MSAAVAHNFDSVVTTTISNQEGIILPEFQPSPRVECATGVQAKHHPFLKPTNLCSKQTHVG